MTPSHCSYGRRVECPVGTPTVLTSKGVNCEYHRLCALLSAIDPTTEASAVDSDARSYNSQRVQLPSYIQIRVHFLHGSATLA